MAEAEFVLQQRHEMVSSLSLPIDDAFDTRPTVKKKGHRPSSLSLDPPEMSLVTNGLISSTPLKSCSVQTPTKQSTLRKSSGKKSKSSKNIFRKHSKKLLHNSHKQSDGDNEECPYSDLDSVPKILCPKALERQPKLVQTQPSVSVAKEVKKPPEIHTGLWFSKSGKDRRPKTTSPMPDRTLFSKVPCKKKNSSAVGKKALAPCSSSSTSGSIGGLSGSSEKEKSLVSAETDPPAEQSEHVNCKKILVANKLCDSDVSPSHQSGMSDKHRSLDSGDTSGPSEAHGISEGRPIITNSMDTVPVTLSSSSHVKKTSRKVGSTDESQCSETHRPIEHSGIMSSKKVCGQAEEKQNQKNQVSTFSLETDTDSSAKLGHQASLMSKCKLPYVKLIRKDLKVKKISGVTVCSNDRHGCTKSDKTPDKVTETVSKQSDWMGISASVSKNQGLSSESKNVSVKKLKASGGSGLLQLSSEPSLPAEQGSIEANSKAKVSTENESSDAEKTMCVDVTPRSMAYPSSNQSEGKKTSVSNVLSASSHQLCSPEDTNASLSPTSQRDGQSESCEPEGLPSEESTNVPKSKRVRVESVLPLEQPAHLPASNRLMTRALKAMQEVQQRKHEHSRNKVGQKDVPHPFREAEKFSVLDSTTLKTKLDIGTKVKSHKAHNNENGEYDRHSVVSSKTPPSLTGSVESELKSEDEDHSVSSTPPMDFIPLTSQVKAKKGDVHSSSSPSSPFSFMNALKNVEEFSFQSLTDEGSGKPLSFKPDANYRFSTFLMMLKDLHDTRERDGTPLELEIGPPSAHVKEEPSVMPDNTTDEQICHDNSNYGSDEFRHLEGSKCPIFKRPNNKKGSTVGVKKKANRKVPSRERSGPGYPGLGSSRMDFSLVVDHSSPVESMLEQQAGGGRREEERTFKETTRRNMLPLEQRGSDATLGPEQPNGLVADAFLRSMTEGSTSTGKIVRQMQ